MNRVVAGTVAWLCCSAALAGEPASPQGGEPEHYIQAWLGALNTDDSWTVTQQEPDQGFVGGLGTLPFGGGAAQQLWGQGRFRFGYEAGGLVSWKNDNTQFFGSSGSGTLVVTTHNTFLGFGVFMGGVASMNVTRYLRLQLAAGPSLMWARLDGDDGNDASQQPAGQATVVVTGESSHDVSLVPYGRVGLEVLLDDGLTFGVSARYAKDEFDFGRNGDLEVDEVLWLLTIGSRL